jgi:hypothetical protein
MSEGKRLRSDHGYSKEKGKWRWNQEGESTTEVEEVEVNASEGRKENAKDVMDGSVIWVESKLLPQREKKKGREIWLSAGGKEQPLMKLGS